MTVANFVAIMEIISSGGLYGKISIDSLGKVRPETRNAVLANILELLSITENRYSGIPTILTEFKNAGLPEPEFSVYHGEFKVIFKNCANLEKAKAAKAITPEAILDFCSTPKTRAELIEYTGMSRYYTMSALVQPLIEAGKLEMTMPDKPKSPYQKYFKA